MEKSNLEGSKVEGIIISGKEPGLINSHFIPIIQNKRYRVASKISVIRGKPFSICFAVILLGENKKEITRYVRWVKDNDNKEREYEITFSTTTNTRYVVLGYRINRETPISSYVIAHLSNLDTKLEEVYDDTLLDSYDTTTPDINEIVPKLPTLNKEQEDDLERKVVLILGFYRSGTTWLGRDLLSYRSMEYWHEPDIGRHLTFLGYRINDANYFLDLQNKKNWIGPLRSLILNRAYSQSQSLDKTIVVKDPSATIVAETLMEILPHSKMIFLLRDGRDVIDSNIDALQPDSWGAQKPKVSAIENEDDRKAVIKSYAEMWKNAAESTWRAYEKHDVKSRLLVKYENLRSNTFAELKRIYDFVGVKISDGELADIVEHTTFESIPEKERGKGKFYRMAKPGAWCENLRKDEIETIESIIGPTLKKFGYQ